MQTLNQKITQALSTTAQGPKLFSKMMGNAHLEFFGSKLNLAKQNKLAAAVLGFDNVHAFLALTADANSSDTIQDKLESLMRGDDDRYSDGYFDFFFPIFSMNYRDRDDDEDLVRIGIWTTFFFNDDDKRIEVSQIIKAEAFYTDELTDLYFTESKRDNTPTLSGIDPVIPAVYQLDNITEQAKEALKIGPTHVKKLLAQIESDDDNKYLNVNYILNKLVRAIQSIEMQRITSVLGVQPTLDYSVTNNEGALFSGFIDYTSL